MKTSIFSSAAIAIFVITMAGCASVNVTKTASGYFEPTNPNDVQILKTRPDKKYIELGTLSVEGYDIGEVAKMYNAIRAKAAPLGADAVIITDESVLQSGFEKQRYATGVAIKFTAENGSAATD